MNAQNTSKTYSTSHITLVAARELIAESITAANEIGIKVTVAVTDAAGQLTAFERVDGSPLLAIDVAIDKAYTVAGFGLGTHVWNEILKDSNVAQLAHRPRLVSVGGGCAIVECGKVIGGIGISGGTALQDQQAAEKALRVLGYDVV
jgi:uncharacterized protein GlcG (DUF336 family)